MQRTCSQRSPENPAFIQAHSNRHVSSQRHINRTCLHVLICYRGTKTRVNTKAHILAEESACSLVSKYKSVRNAFHLAWVEFHSFSHFQQVEFICCLKRFHRGSFPTLHSVPFLSAHTQAHTHTHTHTRGKPNLYFPSLCLHQNTGTHTPPSYLSHPFSLLSCL